MLNHLEAPRHDVPSRFRRCRSTTSICRFGRDSIKGYLRDEGLDVEIEVHETIDAVYERLRDGHVQCSRGTTEHVIIDREQGGDQEIIGGNLNKLPFSLIAAKHIKSIEDLRGGRVGVSSIAAGSSSLIMKIFAAHGLEYPRDYTLVPCGPIPSAMGAIAVWRN